ncbi:uncharacterized protein PHALS_06900 [Plasmopara halstedii]|uniref:Uncharacterized protein n=1 Tax=Plasmopara halstedii TaxID=4781 RepID=A0A0P1B4R6_PLAHL|nr:uncharacterized protein PHALS_06900 [Plasmopara halstedii]CEG49118.1 hypothetical protein PHALS_06900 [Plasmopara halstedii]|eukprot:XP_024585487.1 hypothetical protein PHALS_06900 [Plasmopara halstedii]
MILVHCIQFYPDLIQRRDLLGFSTDGVHNPKSNPESVSFLTRKSKRVTVCIRRIPTTKRSQVDFGAAGTTVNAFSLVSVSQATHRSGVANAAVYIHNVYSPVDDHDDAGLINHHSVDRFEDYATLIALGDMITPINPNLDSSKPQLLARQWCDAFMSRLGHQSVVDG